MKKDLLAAAEHLVIMSENSMSNSMQDLFERFICRLISAHRYYPYRICELITQIPRVEFFVIMIISDSGCAVERVCKERVDLRELAGVQVQAKPNFRLSICS